MAIDRRTFLSGIAAASAVPVPAAIAAAPSDAYAAACVDDSGAHAVAVFDPAHPGLTRTTLPARGHDIAVRPGTREAIVFARRPGRFAVVFDRDGRQSPRHIDCAADRHFFGHGVYADNGRLLLSTENDVTRGCGVLGIRDASGGYASIGMFDTGGVGPHDVALLSDARTLVVANGGIDTDPDGRDAILLTEMKSSLTYLDLATGTIGDRVELDAALRLLSIRHLAIGRGDCVLFGCQWEGERTEHPPLVGMHRRGQPVHLFNAPRDIHLRMKNYIGSVAVDASGSIACAAAPKGGLVAYWDLATGRYLGASELADACGLSAMANPGEFLLSSGTGALCTSAVGHPSVLQNAAVAETTIHWDNHVVRFSG
ncbi:MAG: DUF1513 domain-containing protein [Hyphomicrobium sp.]